MPTTYTPIRYPGGKTKLYPLLESIISRNDLKGCTYAEPFAGGAGAAIKLLLKDNVSKILINDYDRAVFCMWKVILEHPDEVCFFIDSAELTIDEWFFHRNVYQSQELATDIELGLSALYLNRTNRSGILNGGVIGGIAQKGPYKIDARFGKKGLKEKIKRLAQRADDIEIFNLDAESFIVKVLDGKSNVFAYLDPPYVQKGPGLYRSSFNQAKHESLAKTIQECQFPWVATYDNDQLVADLYGENIRRVLTIGYSAYKASSGKEVLICSDSISLEAGQGFQANRRALYQYPIAG